MKWAVLVGGTGSNLKAILASGIEVGLVISHKSGVGAIAIAEQHGVPTEVMTARQFPDRVQYDRELVGRLRHHDIERVAMAGFLRWLQSATIHAYAGGIVNLHPSLLPAYPGLHAIERAYHDGVLWTGVSVHFVDEGHDTGPLIAQVPVDRRLGDDLSDFEARIHEAEHRLYPRVLHAIDAGAVWLNGGQVRYQEGESEWMHGRF